jgi:hypothetical protein
LIVSNDNDRRDHLIRRWSEAHDVIAATTPLEVIVRLELEGTAVSTVVLAGTAGSADDRELAGFLDATYPWVRLIITPHADRRADEARERSRVPA